MAAPTHTLTAAANLPPRQAAVLILFSPAETEDELVLLFTQRTLNVAHHKGQICFPGGRQDAKDHTLIHTALREVEEEVGLPSEDIVILGHLTPLYVPASNHLIHPIVGWIPRLPALLPNPAEVAQVLLVPLSALLNPHNVSTYTYTSNHQELTAPCYAVAGQYIWGATAMMTSELLEMLPVRLSLTESAD